METALTNSRTRQQWAEIICSDWRKSIDSIIQTGRDLADAKEELPHGQFGLMVENDLPFGDRTARQLMTVATHPAIANRTTTSDLPPSWTVLSELSKLSEADFLDAESRGLIGPDTNVRTARAVATAYTNEGDAPVGSTMKRDMLPAPKEARKIARETGRFVAASDGNIYSGATEEEGRSYASRRDQAFTILRAINALGDTREDAAEWFAKAERHWFHDFRYSAIDDALKFLTALKEAMGVVDA